MDRKRIVIAAAALVLLLTSVVVWKNVRAGVCQVCDRRECRAVLFGLRTRWGFPVRTCCPRCGMISLKNSPGMKAVYATDFATGQRVDAEKAVYVEGGHLVLCHKPEAFPDEVRGAANYTVYDRCLPSVLAFAEPEAAVAYAAKHGGHVLSFVALKESLTKRGG